MYFSDNRKCPKNGKKCLNLKIGPKWGQNWSKIHNVRTAGDRKSVDPQNDHKTSFTIGVFRYYVLLRQPEVPQKCQKGSNLKIGPK